MDSTNLSRLNQFGSPGLCFKKSHQSTCAMSAIPIGAPGCPDFAFCTASMLSARIALALCLRDTACSAINRIPSVFYLFVIFREAKDLVPYYIWRTRHSRTNVGVLRGAFGQELYFLAPESNMPYLCSPIGQYFKA